MSDREEELRQRAYYMWEAEGRPEGRANVHWQMAEIAAAVLSYVATAAPDPSVLPDREMASSEPSASTVTAAP